MVTWLSSCLPIHKIYSDRNTSEQCPIERFCNPLGWRALKTPTAETPGFYGHVTTLTLQYLWPRPPGVWLGGPGCKPGHSGWSWWSPTIKIASGLIPVMTGCRHLAMTPMVTGLSLWLYIQNIVTEIRPYNVGLSAFVITGSVTILWWRQRRQGCHHDYMYLLSY